jgi:excinuclease ABC subunit C
MVSEKLRQKLDLLPRKPGVYIMKDDAGNVIYVGKATSLRSRVRSYFQEGETSPKTQALANRVADIDYIITDSEVEALILECTLIKEHTPFYNIRLKDDKAYPYVRVTVQEDYPRVQVVRRITKDNARYFGPYTDVGALKQSLNFLGKVFPTRTCSGALVEKERPCLNYHIERCTAPCCGKISKEEYRDVVEQVCLFLQGNSDQIIKKLTKEMEKAAAKMEFERAAALRDQIGALEKTAERQKISSGTLEDLDLIAYAMEDDLICVQVFHVREGRVMGRDHFMMETQSSVSGPEILEAFIQQHYTRASFIPPKIALSEEVEDKELLIQWLSQIRGKKVVLHTPKRGRLKKLIELVSRNAHMKLQERLLAQRRAQQVQQEGLEELASLVGLSSGPRRIEGYDISNLGEDDAVGAMVVAIEGIPDSSQYRRFKVKSVQGQDDYGMLREVVGRRIMAYDREELADSFGDKPDLILVDGGLGQLGAVRKVLQENGWQDVAVLSLAEREEEVYLLNHPQPVVLPEDSPAKRILQRLRDEAHRFALSYHHKLRAERVRESALDAIEGVGPRRKRILIDHFGSLGAIKKATLEELASVPGIPLSVARNIYLGIGQGDL